MGNISVVSGCIEIRSPESLEQAEKAIHSFDYDEVWPFTNIFWCNSPAQYHYPVVGFAGSYKQVEEAWSEWLWKFAHLLSKMDALGARVHLDCVMGNHSWELRPKAYCVRGEGPKSMIGQQWVIASGPEKDFSIDPVWLNWVENGMSTPDKATGKLLPYRWDKFLERLPIAWLQK